MNFVSHKFASVLKHKKEQKQTNKNPNKLQVAVDKGIEKTKILYYMISFNIFTCTPSGRIGGSELGGGCGVLQGAPHSLEAVDLSVALLWPLNQSNLDSKFFRTFRSF